MAAIPTHALPDDCLRRRLAVMAASIFIRRPGLAGARLAYVSNPWCKNSRPSSMSPGRQKPSVLMLPCVAVRSGRERMPRHHRRNAIRLAGTGGRQNDAKQDAPLSSAMARPARVAVRNRSIGRCEFPMRPMVPPCWPAKGGKHSVAGRPKLCHPASFVRCRGE